MITGMLIAIDPAVLGLLMAGSALVGAVGGRLVRRLRGLMPPFPATRDPLAGLFQREAFAEALCEAGKNHRADDVQGQRAMMAALRRFWAQEHDACEEGEYIVPAGELIEVSFLPPPHNSLTGLDAQFRALPSTLPSPRLRA